MRTSSKRLKRPRTAAKRIAPFARRAFARAARPAALRGAPGRGVRLATLLLAALLVSARSTACAAPDFSSSTIEASPGEPRAGDVVDFRLRLRNTGDVPAESVQVEIQTPAGFYLLDERPAPGVEVDLAEREIRTATKLSVGEERSVAFRLLAPRDSGGTILSVSAKLGHFAGGLQEHRIHGQFDVGDRERRGGVRLGGFRWGLAEGLLTGWLAAAATLWIALRATAGRSTPDRRSPRRTDRSDSPTATTLALMVPLGFWLIFATMAWRDLATLTRWVETSATIVGGRTVIETSSSGSSGGKSRGSSETTTATPEFALRYEVDGRPVYSTGFDSGSSLHFGGRVSGAADWAGRRAGETIVCWYDPADPTDVVVRRGFGGAYLFALFPVPVFWLGLVGLRRRFGAIRRTTSAGGHSSTSR